MRRILIFTSLLLFNLIHVYATHNRAGEIIYRQISELTYEITVITYTNTRPGIIADRSELEVHWGDNTLDTVPRIEELFLPNYYKRNKYVYTHTFPGAGTYEIVMMDPNRNSDVQNIPNSVNVFFTIRTTLQINPFIGHNNTPILLNPPIDRAAIGHTFIHNPAAYDPDGDSLSFKMAVCLGDDGKPIPNFSLPSASDSIWVDPITGDLIGEKPDRLGIFNVAIAIEEWRKGVKIGSLIRDMQLEVYEADNKPPQIKEIEDICVEAGELIQFNVTAFDPDTLYLIDTVINTRDTIIIRRDTIYDKIKLSAQGGPFILANSPAVFKTDSARGKITIPFKWQTNCSHVRKQPYLVIFKAVDEDIKTKNKEDRFPLTDFENVYITVVGPPPRMVNTSPTNSTIHLEWQPPKLCGEAIGYKIYRRERKSGFVPSHCETGVPAYTKYKQIKQIEGINNTSFLDNNDGKGLWQGVTYCYMITAYYADGAESYASEEVCDNLVRGLPLITNVTVNETDTQNGEIEVRWMRPTKFDSIAAPGPYQYIIYHSPDLWGKSFTKIGVIDGIDNTSFIDKTINTHDSPWTYMIGFYNNQPGNFFNIGIPEIASSVFIDVEEAGNQLTLNFRNNTPWEDSTYVLYKRNLTNIDVFDSLTTTAEPLFVDSGLVDGQEYCYLVKSIGYYSADRSVYPIINWSQIACGIPQDTTPPCQPNLTVVSNCDSMRNELTWSNPNNYCSDDAQAYHVYYTPTLEDQFQLIATINDIETVKFNHNLETSLAGCYAVTAIDKSTNHNESKLESRICVDACMEYRLPNVFTPDGNDINDIFKPYPYKYVEKVDMKIFNRWGNLVFQTADPEINWNGKHLETNKLVADGVYYYVCDVYERRLTGLEPRNMTGFIHVYAKEKTNKP